MFFKKQEPKPKNTCITIMIGALAIIGAYTVAEKGKKFIKEKAKCLGSMMGMMQSSCSQSTSSCSSQ